MIGLSKNVIRALLVSMALPLLAACATSGATFTETQTSAAPLAANSVRIYFYRESGMMGAAVQPSVVVDGNVAGAAVPGGFFYVDVPAGSHKISATTEKEEDLNITIEAGQTRYVRLDLSVGVFAGHISPTLVDNNVGLSEIKDCHYIGKK